MLKYLNDNRLIFIILIFGFFLRIIIDNIFDIPQFVDVRAYEKAGSEIFNKFQLIVWKFIY